MKLCTSIVKENKTWISIFWSNSVFERCFSKPFFYILLSRTVLQSAAAERFTGSSTTQENAFFLQ